MRRAAAASTRWRFCSSAAPTSTPSPTTARRCTGRWRGAGRRPPRGCSTTAPTSIAAPAFGGTRGVTPLHVAAAWEGSPDCARLLLARGADRSIKDAEQDGTPAGWAAFFKNDAIREMIEQDLGIGRARWPISRSIRKRSHDHTAAQPSGLSRPSHADGPSRAAGPAARDRARAGAREVSGAGARAGADGDARDDRARASDGLRRAGARGRAEGRHGAARCRHHDVAGHLRGGDARAPAAPCWRSTR